MRLQARRLFGSSRWGLIAAVLVVAACDGRELTVFDLPGQQSAGSGGSSGGSAGASADPSGGSAGSSAGAGFSSGGSLTGPGAGFSSGGSAGMPDTGGTLGFGGGSTTCGSDDDCMPGWLCEMNGCDATSGECVPWPPLCPPDPAPVCGCNGVTYWNDCIRLNSRARLAASDQCRATACSCEVGADCMVADAVASCSHLLPPGAMCGHGMGSCWVLPSQCTPNADPKMWRECKPPDAGGAPPACVDTCTAIASERPFAELKRGEPCN